MILLGCGHKASSQREVNVDLCCECEIVFHGCSTGDCPHQKQSECDAALHDLKKEQGTA